MTTHGNFQLEEVIVEAHKEASIEINNINNKVENKQSVLNETNIVKKVTPKMKEFPSVLPEDAVWLQDESQQTQDESSDNVQPELKTKRGKKKGPGRPRKTPVKQHSQGEGVVNTPLNDENYMEFAHFSPTLFKTLDTLVKKYGCQHVIFKFNKDHITMESIDTSENTRLYFNIYGQRVKRYYCCEEYSVTIDSTNLQNVFKNINKDHTEIIFSSKSHEFETCLYINLINENLNKVDCFALNITMSEILEPEPENKEKYVVSFSLSTRDWKTEVGRMSDFGDTLNICIDCDPDTQDRVLKLSPNDVSKTNNRTIEHHSIYRDSNIINLKTQLDIEQSFEIGVGISYIKPLSISGIGERIYFYCREYGDMCFETFLERDTCRISIYTKIN